MCCCYVRRLYCSFILNIVITSQDAGIQRPMLLCRVVMILSYKLHGEFSSERDFIQSAKCILSIKQNLAKLISLSNSKYESRKTRIKRRHCSVYTLLLFVYIGLWRKQGILNADEKIHLCLYSEKRPTNSYASNQKKLQGIKR